MKEPGKKDRKKKKKKQAHEVVRDRHLLYTAAVQSVEADLDFFERIYRKTHKKTFTRLCEDFCGTAVLACEWVRRRKANHAWGVDLDQPTLDWGARNYVSALGPESKRVRLQRRDVLDPVRPRVDVIAALNFSYCVFKTRDELRAYFSRTRASLAPGGIFFLDAFGGTEAMTEDTEKRKIGASKAFDGTPVPGFTYVWEQKSFNIVDHRIVCNIHFKLADGSRLPRAFHYDWRLWTLPELCELMLEAGFRAADVYLEGWDEEADDTDGIFRRRARFENQDGWVAYVVGHT